MNQEKKDRNGKVPGAKDLSRKRPIKKKSTVKNRSDLTEKSKPNTGHFIFKEIFKGMAGILVLVSILATSAMVADLYFNNSFRYLSLTFLRSIYSTADKSETTLKNKASLEEKSSSKNEYDSASTDSPVFEVFDDEPDPRKNIPAENHIAVNGSDSGNGKRANSPDIKQDAEGNDFKKASPVGKIPQYEEFDGSTGVLGSHLTEEKAKSHRDRNAHYPSSRSRVKKRGAPPLLVIIIDDIGYDRRIAESISRIDRDITISILPGSPYGKSIASSLHSRGVELMLHLPMEPVQFPSVDPGRGAIMSDMAPEEILSVLKKDLAAVPYIKGVNNHMGSKLTSIAPYMQKILLVLKTRNLYFIDSLTSGRSVGRECAAVAKLPFASRDVFLDNRRDRGYIKRQLLEAVRISSKRGSAIAIGHPYDETCSVLKVELGKIKKTVKIVPASQLVRVLQHD